MKTIKDLDRKTFKEQFQTREQCLSYLSSQKWSKGYYCLKCSNNQFIRGKQLFSRRCVKCCYDESATANTLFHKLKFNIEVAFEMVYDIVLSKKGANSLWLAERYSISQNTAWLFRHKVQIAMQSSQLFPLENEVHIDEFEIGTPKEGQQGRCFTTDKIRVVLAVEYRDGKCGRGYAKVIQDYSSDSLRPIFDEHITKNAEILADGWRGYSPLKNEYPNLSQTLSEKGRNFPMIHNQIRNFKNWLRGVHSYCTSKYMTKYIDEYFYRFNRRNHRKSIVFNLLNRMIEQNPVTLTQIQGVAI